MSSSRPPSYNEGASSAQITPIPPALHDSASKASVIVNNILPTPLTTPIIVGNDTSAAAKKKKQSRGSNLTMLSLLATSFAIPIWMLGHYQLPSLGSLYTPDNSTTTNSTQTYVDSTNAAKEILISAVSSLTSDFTSANSAMTSTILAEKLMALTTFVTSGKEARIPKVTNEVVIGL